MKYFEARTDYHPLDYRFKKSRIINLNKEYNCIHLSVASSFIRRKAIGDNKFVIGLTSGEDTLFVNKLFINKPFYGVMKNALYFYRRRNDGTSIVQKSIINDVFYFKTPILVHQNLLDLSYNKFNKLIPFIQFYVAYDILFRILSSTFKYIDLPKLIKYSQIIIKLLKRIDDKFLLEQKNVEIIIKIYALSKKHKMDMREFIKYKKGKLKYKKYDIFKISNNKKLIILNFVDINDNFLQIEARDNCWMKKEKYYYLTELLKEEQ